LTTSCRLQVYRLKECPCIWCVYVNMVTFLLFMFCSVSLYIYNCWNNNPNNCYQRPSSGHKMHQIRFRPGLRPDPAEEAHDAPLDSLFGWGGDTPAHSPPPWHLRGLHSHAFGVRLGAFGASLSAFRHFFFHSLSTAYCMILVLNLRSA